MANLKIYFKTVKEFKKYLISLEKLTRNINFNLIDIYILPYFSQIPYDTEILKDSKLILGARIFFGKIPTPI